MSLPLACRAADVIGAKVVVDLHEYAPLELEGLIWNLFLRPLREYVLRRYIPETVASITVNQTIAEKYHIEFGFLPIVVLNTPQPNPGITFRPTSPDRVQLIHHGILAQVRKPELMVLTVAHLDTRFDLNFMLMGDPAKISFKEIPPTKLPLDGSLFTDQYRRRASPRRSPTLISGSICCPPTITIIQQLPPISFLTLSTPGWLYVLVHHPRWPACAGNMVLVL